jgi:hypothetical protein
MKPFISEYDSGKLSSFIRTSAAHLSEQGMILKRRAEALLRHDKQVRKLAAADPKLRENLFDKDNGSMGAGNLIAKFSKLYSTHSGFKDDLIVCLLEAVIAKVEGNNNVKLAPKAASFFSALYSTSPKGFDVVSGNLWGPSKRAMQVRHAVTRAPPFICFDEDSIQQQLGQIVKQLTSQGASTGGNAQLTFSI